eukprot:4840194-Lingulodinium_polyedra.AAC.1
MPGAAPVQPRYRAPLCLDPTRGCRALGALLYPPTRRHNASTRSRNVVRLWLLCATHVQWAFAILTLGDCLLWFAVAYVLAHGCVMRQWII